MKNYIITKTETKYGANYNKKTGNIDFKLFTMTAEDVILCVFKNPIGDVPFFETLMEKDGNVFRASIHKKKLLKKQKVFYYGFRIFGENFKKVSGYKIGSDIGFVSKLDDKGNRFNPNKLAYDPYSIELSHVHSSVSSDITPFRSGGDNFLSDNSKIAPKSVFRIPKEEKIRKAPARPLKDEIIAEVHLKDLTRLVKMKEKGTYKGARKFIKEIKKTGITMIEFLPVSEFDQYIDCKNHWGYMPLNYFAPKKSYSYKKEPYEALYEFRKMADEFHKNGIKICLDVVYNHTGEGRIYDGDNNDARLFSYALIDNKNYYKLAQNAHYTNHSGCGNDFNTITPVGEDLIVDSLNFWINQGVDAFRFDLAVALMDDSSSGYAVYNNTGGMLKNLKKRLEDLGHNIKLTDEKGDGVHLIAEPWMCSGACCYQLGNFPSYFAEWNDIARDTIRALTIRPNDVTPLAIRNVLEGTPQKFKNEIKSINYVSCHDGFTLFDLNSCAKPNEKTEGGSSYEMCSNYKCEIKEQDNAIRKQILMLMVSKGIPMIQFGDIFLHSKLGNNNSYNLDNEINRIDYDLDDRKKGLSNYIKELIKFRNENTIFKEKYLNDRIEYLYTTGEVIPNNHDSYWKNPNSNIICLNIKDVKNSYYIAISKDSNEIELTLPQCDKDKQWYLIADTKENIINNKGIKYIENKYILKSYSACIFKEKRIKKWI